MDGLAEQHLHSHEDAKKWVNSWISSNEVIFPKWNSNAARKIGKVVDGRTLQVKVDGQYFNKLFFTNVKSKALIKKKKYSENLFKVPVERINSLFR